MLRIVHLYIQAITRLNRALFLLAAGLMAVVVVSMMAEVISRYLFHTPTLWGMELATLVFGPYFLLGGPYLLHVGGHVNMDLLRGRMSPRVGLVVDCVNQIIILMFCAILLYYATPLVLQSIEYRETTFSAWNPPLWPIKIAVPVAVLLLGLQSLAEIARTLLGEVDGEESAP